MKLQCGHSKWTVNIKLGDNSLSTNHSSDFLQEMAIRNSSRDNRIIWHWHPCFRLTDCLSWIFITGAEFLALKSRFSVTRKIVLTLNFLLYMMTWSNWMCVCSYSIRWVYNKEFNWNQPIFTIFSELPLVLNRKRSLMNFSKWSSVNVRCITV